MKNRPNKNTLTSSYTLLSVLNDLMDAFTTLLEKRNKQPALIMMFAFIDICAALANNEAKKSNSDIFKDFINSFGIIGRGSLTAVQLWAARSSLLHSFSPLGHHTGPGKSKPIFYYSWPEEPGDVRRTLEVRGYSGFILVPVSHIKAMAIGAYNTMIIKMEKDSDFMAQVLENAKDLLLSQSAYRIEELFSQLDAVEAGVHKS